MSRCVIENEPATLSYYFVAPMEYEQNLSDAHFLWAFEMYETAADLDQVHNNSAAMARLVENVSPIMLTGFDMQRCEVTGGFQARGGPEPAGIVYRTWIKAVPGHRGDILASLQSAAEKANATEPGTLSYLIVCSLGNDSHVCVLQRFRDRSAWLDHMKGDLNTETFINLREKVASIDRRGFVETPNNFFIR